MTPLRLLLCFLCLLPVQAAKTACRVPSVRESYMTTLTCYFPEDVSQSKKDFAVYHYSGNKPPDPVVDCLWVGGKVNCYMKPGYTYDTIISNKTVVQIPQVSANHTGKYTCQISGSQPEDLEVCELFISPETRTCELQSEESKEETRLTCIFPENIAQSKKDFAVHHFDDHGRQVVVVDCFWYMDSLSCKTNPGYQSDNKVTNRFEVRILQTSGHQNGSYLCEMTGSRPNYVSICSFPQGGHVYDMATDAARGSSNAAAAVLGILLAITLAVIVCVIIYIKCKHPQVLQNITRSPNRKKGNKETIKSPNNEVEETEVLMTQRESKTLADRALSLFTNTVQRFSRGRNAAPTNPEKNVEEAGNISDEQFHRKRKAHSVGVETDRVQVETAAVQITEEDFFIVFDPRTRSVPETRAEVMRQPELVSYNVTVEVEEATDSTKRKKSTFPFFWIKPKGEQYRQTEREVDTRRHSRPVENPPQSRGDTRNPVLVKSSIINPSGYAEYQEEPGRRQTRMSDEPITVREPTSNLRTGAQVSDPPYEAPSDVRALPKSGSTVMPETGAKETLDKTSKSKKSKKQDRKEADSKDTSKGGFGRSSSKKQTEEKASAAQLSAKVCEDADEVDTQLVSSKISENEDKKRGEEKKKKTSSFFSRSKKDAKTATAAAPLLGDKMNENPEETGRNEPQPVLIKDSDKRKNSKKMKEK